MRSPFEVPDLPKACARCGTPYALTRQPLRARTHVVDLFFCQACWMRVATARRLSLVAALFASVTLVGGAALWASTGRGSPFVLASALSAAAVAGAALYRRRAMPRYLVADRKNLVLDVPGVGRVLVQGEDSSTNAHE